MKEDRGTYEKERNNITVTKADYKGRGRGVVRLIRKYRVFLSGLCGSAGGPLMMLQKTGGVAHVAANLLMERAMSKPCRQSLQNCPS